MSSTVVLGVVEGNDLMLASVGDSRAYLVTNGEVEQLTIDGDVRCVYLAAGVPPEQVRDLGSSALALYQCLGVGEVGQNNLLMPSVDRSNPSIGHWKLLPGDIVVLCTDGLVEEGVFLEPLELAWLAKENDSAEELARVLVTAAVARHRDSSLVEPEGCGDDATCIVLIARPG